MFNLFSTLKMRSAATLLKGIENNTAAFSLLIDLPNIQGCEIFENAKISKANEFSMAANGVFWKMNYYSYFTAEVLNVQYFVR